MVVSHLSISNMLKQGNFLFILQPFFFPKDIKYAVVFHLFGHLYFLFSLIHAELCFCLYFICFFWQAGGNSIVMDANATAQLRNQGLASTDDSPKFMWPKVRCHLNFFFVALIQLMAVIYCGVLFYN